MFITSFPDTGWRHAKVAKWLLQLPHRRGQWFSIVAGIDFQQEWHGGFCPFARGGIIGRRAAESAAQHVGGDDAGIERHSGHARRQFLRERLRESLNRPLRRAIRRDFRVGRASPTGTEIHDDSPALFYHRRNKMADDVRHALDVDINDARKFFGRNKPERRVAVDERGVVEQQIRRGLGLQNALRPRGDLSVGGNVHGGEVVRCGKLFLQLCDFFFRTSAADDDVAEPDEFLCQRTPQSARCAGDENGFHNLAGMQRCGVRTAQRAVPAFNHAD
jgi:hypothetical protein